MKIFTANVGVNANRSNGGFYSPLFGDDTFEFIPIPDNDPSKNNWYYRHLKSPNSGGSLLDYIPKRFHGAACHNDPEFETMTYGDVWSGRGANLQQMDIDDVLLFIAHLRRWGNGEPSEEHGFYLIGGLRIERLHTTGERLEDEWAERFSKNAHFIDAEERGYGGDMFFAGDERSRRFKKAVPLNRNICDQVFRDAQGKEFDWTKQGGNETRIIGSYTRTCRCLLDTIAPKQAQRTATLRAWIAKHGSDGDTELLGSGE